LKLRAGLSREVYRKRRIDEGGATKQPMLENGTHSSAHLKDIMGSSESAIINKEKVK
jgi:hypothetical protein